MKDRHESEAAYALVHIQDSIFSMTSCWQRDDNELKDKNMMPFCFGWLLLQHSRAALSIKKGKKKKRLFIPITHSRQKEIPLFFLILFPRRIKIHFGWQDMFAGDSNNNCAAVLNSKNKSRQSLKQEMRSRTERRQRRRRSGYCW